MRKVNIDIVATVMVPVKVKASLLVRADEGINMERALNLFAKGQPTYNARAGGADLEDIELVEITNVKSTDELDERVTEALEQGFTVINSKVTDSR